MEGCRGCKYAENNLKKIDGWDEHVTIIGIRDEDGNWCEEAKGYGVDSTPCLVALRDGELIARMAGGNYMTKGFFSNLLDKFK